MVISLTTAVLCILGSVLVGAVVAYFVLKNSKNGVQKTADAAVQRVEQKVDEMKNHFDQNRPL